MGQKTECEIQKELVSNLLSTGATNKGLKKFKELLNGDFLLFANKENALANEAEMILKLQEIEKELEIISAYPLLHTKNVVAVGGGFSAGKSEFISSFIQSDVKLPIGVVPTTAIPTYVFHEEKRNFLGCSSKGGIVDLEKIDEDFQSKLSHDFIKSFDFNLKDIMPYLLIASPLSHDHICFVDTPGYNPATISDGFTSEDVKTAKDFLENANALLWLIGGDSNGTIGNTDLQFLENLNLEDKKLYVVFNKADLKPLDDLEDILEEIAESLEDADIDVEGISAYSSIMQEEYTHKGKTLEEFLQNCNNFISKHQELLQRVYSVYEAYRVATQNKIDEKKNAKEELHSLSLDIFEEGIDLDKPVHERVTKIQEYFSTEQEEENLKTLKSVFEEFKNSINDVFGIVKEYMDNETKTQDPVQEEDIVIKTKNILEAISNIFGIEYTTEILNNQYKKSDEIHILKKKDILTFIKEINRTIEKLKNSDIEEIQKKIESIPKIKTKSIEVLNKTCNSEIDTLEYDIKSSLLDKLNSYFRDSKQDISNSEGSKTESYTVSTSPWSNPWSWGDDRYETRHRTYTTVKAGHIRNSLDELTDKIKSIDIEVKRTIEEWKKKLFKDIVRTLREVVGDSNLEIDLLSKTIKQIVNSVTYPEVNYGGGLPSSLRKSGTLEGSSAERFIDDARDYVDNLKGQVKSDINSYIKNLVQKLKETNIADSIFKKYESDMKKFEDDINNKTMMLEKYNMIVSELEKL
ncbi:dynamin family protein [Sulfurimonas sp. NW15]|uniref:dynamin family protein n=1 Tax=Sulfurimonas sp. NW15 TaxID=2922729 RepID=UPI003DA90D3D